MSLPAGVVTFVFSDIEGSTRLWEADPEAMRLSLGRHDALVSEVVGQAGGSIFKHTGDGFGAAFVSVSAALEAAAGLAARMAAEPWPGAVLRSRIGVHSGEAEPHGGDYFGTAVTRASRVTDAANGGQILVSEPSHRLVAGVPPNGSVFIDMGEHRLKDLRVPIGLYRMVGPGASENAPLRTLERAPHNLPIQLSSFIGREGQIKEIVDLSAGSRLVTLTGVGGVGKTRLALQVAAETLPRFQNGVWFVDLSPVTEPALLADAVAEALEVPPDNTVSVEHRIVRYLADRGALVLLDNCEHLIDAAARLVDRILRSCPEVHVLATSREGLAVTGEVLWRVPSLRVDGDAAAVELFAERARLVRPEFTVSDANREVVADLCARLDGIPLAIELATARLQLLTVEQVAERLADRFRLLTGGSRTAVERQRTLLAMMDWSYDLLTGEARALLRRLAVFSGGFTIEAAEDVCSGQTQPHHEILDLLQHLVEASLVTFDNEARPRYRLLETVRQYALEKLFEAGEADEARLRHAGYFAGIAARLGARLDHGDPTAMEEGSQELANSRAAMTWCLEAEQGDLLLQLAVGLRYYFWNSVMYRESVRWLTAAIGLAADTASDLFSEAVAMALTDAENAADAPAVQRLLPMAERLHETTGSDLARGQLANALAVIAMRYDLRRADAMFREAHQMLRRAGSARWTAPLQNRSMAAWVMYRGESAAEVLALAAEAMSEGLTIHLAVVETVFMTTAERYAEVIDKTVDHDPGDQWDRAILLLFRAHAERALGRLRTGLDTAARAETIFGPNFPGSTAWEMGMTHLMLGDVDAAVQAFRSIYDAGELTGALTRVQATAFWAMVAGWRGDHDVAALLWGFRDALMASSSVGMARFDLDFQSDLRQRTAAALGERRFDELLRQGGQTPWEELPLARGGAASLAADQEVRDSKSAGTAEADG